MALETIPWTTAAELQYLENIGITHQFTKTIPRMELLKRYLEGANRRVNWGDVNKNDVLKAAHRMLTKAALEKEQSKVKN